MGKVLPQKTPPVQGILKNIDLFRLYVATLLWCPQNALQLKLWRHVLPGKKCTLDWNTLKNIHTILLQHKKPIAQGCTRKVNIQVLPEGFFSFSFSFFFNHSSVSWLMQEERSCCTYNTYTATNDSLVETRYMFEVCLRLLNVCTLYVTVLTLARSLELQHWF